MSVAVTPMTPPRRTAASAVGANGAGGAVGVEVDVVERGSGGDDPGVLLDRRRAGETGRVLAEDPARVGVRLRERERAERSGFVEEAEPPHPRRGGHLPAGPKAAGQRGKRPRERDPEVPVAGHRRIVEDRRPAARTPARRGPRKEKLGPPFGGED